MEGAGVSVSAGTTAVGSFAGSVSSGGGAEGSSAGGGVEGAGVELSFSFLAGRGFRFGSGFSTAVWSCAGTRRDSSGGSSLTVTRLRLSTGEAGWTDGTVAGFGEGVEGRPGTP